MNWLNSIGDTSADLSSDEGILSLIAGLAKWLEHGDDVKGKDNPLSLLKDIADGEAPPKGLKDLPNNSDQLAKKLLEFIGDKIPESYQSLTCHLSKVGSTECAGTKTIQWSPLDKSGSSAKKLDPLSFKLKAGVKQSFAFEAHPELPEDISSVTGSQFVRMGLKGSLNANASADLPVRFAKFGFGAKGAGDIALNYYFRHDVDRIFARALANNLRELTSPFDLATLQTAIYDRRLHAITLSTEGQMGYSGSIDFGKAFDIVQSVGAAIKFSYKFSATRSGMFHYSVTQHSDGKRLKVKIRRGPSFTQTEQLGVGIGIDFTELFTSYKQELLSHLKEFEGVFKELDDFIPAGLLIRDRLKKQVDKLLKDDETQRIVFAALGLSGNQRVGALLQQKLETVIMTNAGIWQQEAKTSVVSIMDELLESISITDASNVAKLREKLTPAVTDAIDDLSTKFDKKVKELVTGNSFKKVATALDKAGVKIDATITGADNRIKAVTAPLKQALTKYQGMLKKFTTAIEKATEVKLALSWTHQETRSGGSSIDAELLFDPSKPNAEQAFKEIMVGSLDKAFDVASNAKDASVELIDGEYRRYASLDRSSGFEAVLLDFSLLKTTSILNADVEITNDNSGNIRVMLRSESAYKTNLFGEKRDINFVNAYELALASKTQHGLLKMTVSHDEENLDDKEVKQFFSHLEKSTQLLPAGTTNKAIGLLNNLSQSEADSKRRAILRIWVNLDNDDFKKLLDSAAKQGGDESVYRTAVRCIARGNKIAGPATDWKNVETLVKNEDLASSVTDLLLNSFESADFNVNANDIDTFDEKTLEEIGRMRERALQFYNMLSLMRQIYHSADKAWDEETYLEKQQEIDQNVKFWIKGEVSDFLMGLFGDEIRPYTLSLLLVLKELVGDSMQLQAGLFIKEGDSITSHMLT